MTAREKKEYRAAYEQVNAENKERYGDMALSEIAVAAQISARVLSNIIDKNKA